MRTKCELFKIFSYSVVNVFHIGFNVWLKIIEELQFENVEMDLRE